MRCFRRVRFILALLVLGSVLGLSACQKVPEECCDCIYKYMCVREDTGACHTSKNPCKAPEDDDPWDDEDDDGVVGLISMFCYMFHTPKVTIDRSCAERYKCLRRCPEDDRYVEWE